MTNDLISDMLTRIRNASLARHSFARVRYSKLNLSILKVLLSEGYINSYSLEKNNLNQNEIKIILKYKGWWIKKPLFSILKRISKPGQRVFVPALQWHTYVMRSDFSIIYETMIGKYDPLTWKKMADWAPGEETENSKEYFQSLKNFTV
jgi:ribosomal protein S8